MYALLVDAYDSFIHIISQYLQELRVDVRVVRNDSLELWDLLDNEEERPNFVVLGPGPGHPADSGYVPLLRRLNRNLPVLGICLGHQAIGLAYGGHVEQAQSPRHGKISEVQHDGRGCFRNLPTTLSVTRYHSLVVSDKAIPNELRITARARDDGHIMALRHLSRPIESLQFHPESIGTRAGKGMLENFLQTHVRRHTHTLGA